MASAQMQRSLWRRSRGGALELVDVCQIAIFVALFEFGVEAGQETQKASHDVRRFLVGIPGIEPGTPSV